MNELFNPNVTAFAENYTSAENELLQQVARFTQTQHAEPHMMSSREQGMLLKFISIMKQPLRILEIGTFTGYSALWLAEGLPPDGLLHTIEFRPETAAIAQQYFNQSPFASKIKLHVGDAKTIIPSLNETWDIVFIDADKTGYIEYFDMVLPQVKQNGFILADNIFFHGRVFEENPKGKSAKAVKAFNHYILQQTSVEKLVLTLRDGLYILRKL